MNELKIYPFTERKPLKPYKKVGHYLQFWIELEDLRETKEITLEDGSKETIVSCYYYNKYELAWRDEFSQGAEYNEEGNLVKEDYITANYDSLLAEAKG